MLATTILVLLAAASARAAAFAADAPGVVNALFAAAGNDGGGEASFLNNAFAQLQQPPGPLVDFGSASATRNLTTIDDETLALLSAFAAGERVVSEQSRGGDDKGARAEARLGGLLDALRSARGKVERELATTLDERVFGSLVQLRRRLGPHASLRLIEEAQRARGTECKAGSFTAPKMLAAKIVGPGAFLAVTGPLCSLQRRAAPLQLTLPVACTGAGVLFRETPSIFSASALAAAKATTRECKGERKWGPEGTAEVVLFDPRNLARQFGLLPPGAFNQSGGGGGGEGGGGPEGKAAWKAGAADVREAIQGLWGAMLGNVTVKDEPNGAWKNASAGAAAAGQAEKVAAKFEALRSAVGATVVRAADGGGGDEGGWFGSSSGNGTNATESGGPSAARREAEARLRSLAGEYLLERLLEGQGAAEGAAAAGDGEGGEDGDGDGDGGGDGDGEGAEVPGRPSGGAAEGLLAAMRDLARAAVAEGAPRGLFAVQ